MTQPLSPNLALAVLDNCPFPVLVVDNNGAPGAYNRAFGQLLDALQRRQLQLLGNARLDADALTVLLAEQNLISLSDEAGVQRHLEVCRFTLPDRHPGEVRVFVDASRLVELERTRDSLNAEITNDTLTDPVTGLLNQRGLMLALEPQVARSRRYNNPLALITLAVKPTGNKQALRVKVAQLLKDQLRWADLIGCTERHDFMLVLPETTAEAASKLAAKLECQLIDLPAPADRPPTPWFFFGVTCWRKSDNASTLLKRGTEALARACAERTTPSVAL